MPRLWPALMLAALLTACGGGGGGGAPAPSPGAGAALSFSPAQLSASAAAGSSAALSVTATVTHPADFDTASTVFAYIVDDGGVLVPGAQLVRDSALAYHAVLQTSPSLGVGGHQGQLSVKLCRDSACASQFPGSPVALPYTITVGAAGMAPFSASPGAPLAATMHLGGPAPAPVAIQVLAAGRTWSAAAGAGWLKPVSASGSGDATLTVIYDATGLGAGQYDTVLTLTASDGQVATLPVGLTVLAPAFQVSSNGVAFTAVNGAPIAPQTIQFATDNGQATRWDASSDAGWLRASPSQGYTPAVTALSVDPSAGTLRSGSYNASVTLSAAGLQPRSLAVALTLVPASLQVSSQNVVLGGPYGRDFSPQTITLSLNTGANGWPWALGAPPAWASPSALAGTVNSTPGALTFTPDASAAALGSTSTRVLATVAVNGDLVGLPLNLTINKDRHKLLAAEAGVALSGSPGWARVTRAIAISDNFGLDPAWSAQSDQAWLTVGGAGDSLTLSADATSLTPNTISYATVTVSPTDPAVAAPAPIKVAFWKGSSTPTVPSSPSQFYTNIVADPIRPLVYAHKGGSVIDIYNVYTGQASGSLTGFSGGLGDMAVSADGARLYVLDLYNNRVEGRNLSGGAVLSLWSPAGGLDKTARLAILRPNGVEIVALNNGNVYDSASGKLLATLPIRGGSLSGSGDGKRLYVQDEGGASIHLSTYSIDYAELGGGTLYAAQLAAATHLGSGAAGQDIAASADGSVLYTASSQPALCGALNTSDLGSLYYLASGGAAPNNVETGSDGRVYCGVAGKTSAADVWVYSAAGALLNQLKFAPAGRQLAPRQMVISGDGFMLVGLNDDGALYIVPVGP